MIVSSMCGVMEPLIMNFSTQYLNILMHVAHSLHIELTSILAHHSWVGLVLRPTTDHISFCSVEYFCASTRCSNFTDPNHHVFFFLGKIAEVLKKSSV